MLVGTAIIGDASAGEAAPLLRPIRFLFPREHGRYFGWSLAVAGTRLVVGAPNLDGDGIIDAHALVFDPATSELVHDLPVEVGTDHWWQFAVAALGPHPLVGVSPGDEDARLDGSVTLFDGATGSMLQSWCCSGGLPLAVGDDVLIGGTGGATLYDPATGSAIRTYALADPNGRGVLGMALVGDVLAVAGAEPVGVHLFDVDRAQRIGFAGTNHGNARRFGSAMAVAGSRLAITEVPQVNVFDLAMGALLHTIDAPPDFARGNFGRSLAYLDGLLVVGHPSSTPTRGAVHLFDGTGAVVASLTREGSPPDFGRSVVALGRALAVGAPTASGGEVVIYSPCGDGVVDAPVEECDAPGDIDCDANCRIAGNSKDGCGDADRDGGITLRDGIQVLRAVADLPSLCTLARCDTDGSGALGLGDGIRVLRVVAGLPAGLACPAPGN